MAKTSHDTIPTRRSLLGRLKNLEDERSWRDFFNTYRRLVYGVALKAGLTDVEAQEVVQETFIVVARKIESFDYDPTVGSFKSWLLHTCQWRIADQFRKRMKEPPGRMPRAAGDARTATIERVPDPLGCKLEEVWDQEWEKSIFDTALEKVRHQVKASQYQLFDLYVIKRWPVQKVAKTLGVNIGKVYLAKHRISVLLKKEMRELKREVA